MKGRIVRNTVVNPEEIRKIMKMILYPRPKLYRFSLNSNLFYYVSLILLMSTISTVLDYSCILSYNQWFRLHNLHFIDSNTKMYCIYDM